MGAFKFSNRLYNKDLLSIDALYGPWNSIDEFVQFVTNGSGSLEDIEIPVGITIAVKDENGIKEYWNTNKDNPFSFTYKTEQYETGISNLAQRVDSLETEVNENKVDKEEYNTKVGELESQVSALDAATPKILDGKIKPEYLPSYVDDVLEYDNLNTFPEVGESGKIYVDKQKNQSYRWSGSLYILIYGDDLATLSEEIDSVKEDINSFKTASNSKDKDQDDAIDELQDLIDNALSDFNTFLENQTNLTSLLAGLIGSNGQRISDTEANIIQLQDLLLDTGLNHAEIYTEMFDHWDCPISIGTYNCEGVNFHEFYCPKNDYNYLGLDWKILLQNVPESVTSVKSLTIQVAASSTEERDANVSVGSGCVVSVKTVNTLNELSNIENVSRTSLALSDVTTLTINDVLLENGNRIDIRLKSSGEYGISPSNWVCFRIVDIVYGEEEVKAKSPKLIYGTINERSKFPYYKDMIDGEIRVYQAQEEDINNGYFKLNDNFSFRGQDGELNIYGLGRLYVNNGDFIIAVRRGNTIKWSIIPIYEAKEWWDNETNNWNGVEGLMSAQDKGKLDWLYAHNNDNVKKSEFDQKYNELNKYKFHNEPNDFVGYAEKKNADNIWEPGVYNNCHWGGPDFGHEQDFTIICTLVSHTEREDEPDKKYEVYHLTAISSEISDQIYVRLITHDTLNEGEENRFFGAWAPLVSKAEGYTAEEIKNILVDSGIKKLGPPKKGDVVYYLNGVYYYDDNVNVTPDRRPYGIVVEVYELDGLIEITKLCSATASISTERELNMTATDYSWYTCDVDYTNAELNNYPITHQDLLKNGYLDYGNKNNIVNWIYLIYGRCYGVDYVNELTGKLLFGEVGIYYRLYDNGTYPESGVVCGDVSPMMEEIADGMVGYSHFLNHIVEIVEHETSPFVIKMRAKLYAVYVPRSIEIELDNLKHA